MLKENIKKLKEYLLARQKAYKFVFSDNESVKYVLADLEKFCRGTESCFHPDARVHAHLEGRREVWLRIQHHLNLSGDDLLEKYGKVKDNE